MPRPAGFIIDVPVTLSVAVRGDGLTEDAAIAAVEAFASNLETVLAFALSEYCSSYTESPKGVEISEVSLEATTEESGEVLEELDAEKDEEGEKHPDTDSLEDRGISLGSYGS